MKKFVRRAALVGAIVSVASIGTSTAALADSGGVCSVGCAGDIYYYDNGDLIELSDNKQDDHGVMGWISVQQADGSYKAFPKVYLGTGYNTATAVTQDVVREAATIKLTACWVDGPNGTPYNCGFRYISG